MKSSDLVVGEWYLVRTNPWKWDSETSLRRGVLTEKNTRKGWHVFNVHTQVHGNPLADEYKLEGRVVSSKSILRGIENPVPQPGTDFYKQWIQHGITEANKKHEFREQMEALELMAARFTSIFGDPDDDAAFSCDAHKTSWKDRAKFEMTFESPTAMKEFVNFCKQALHTKYLA